MPRKFLRTSTNIQTYTHTHILHDIEDSFQRMYNTVLRIFFVYMWQGAAINDAKKVLADECTRMLHGESVLASIHETAKAVFAGGGGSLDDLPKKVRVCMYVCVCLCFCACVS